MGQKSNQINGIYLERSRKEEGRHSWLWESPDKERRWRFWHLQLHFRFVAMDFKTVPRSPRLQRPANPCIHPNCNGTELCSNKGTHGSIKIPNGSHGLRRHWTSCRVQSDAIQIFSACVQLQETLGFSVFLEKESPETIWWFLSGKLQAAVNWTCL